MDYRTDHIPKNTPYNRRPGISMAPLYLTIHSTGNLTSSAANERAWLTDNPQNKREASYHIVVDEMEAIEVLPLNEVAWHAGDGNGPGNRASIAIEICESGNRQDTLANAARLVAKMLRERKWGVDRLRRHYDWSRKECPRILMANNWAGWEKFKQDVAKELNPVEKTKVTVNGQECDAFIYEGKTYVEVRKPFEAAGFRVNYNAATKRTEIISPRPPAPADKAKGFREVDGK